MSERVKQFASHCVLVTAPSVSYVHLLVHIRTYSYVYSFKRNHRRWYRCSGNQRSGSHPLETGETPDSIIVSGVVIVILAAPSPPPNHNREQPVFDCDECDPSRRTKLSKTTDVQLKPIEMRFTLFLDSRK